MHQFLNVLDGPSAHHQEFKTVHTATGMSHRYCYLPASGNRWQAGRSICLTYNCCCMYSLELLMIGAKTVRNM